MADEKIDSIKLQNSDDIYKFDLAADSDITINSAKITTATINNLTAQNINLTKTGTDSTATVSFKIGDSAFSQTVNNVDKAIHADRAYQDSDGNMIKDSYFNKTAASAPEENKLGLIKASYSYPVTTSSQTESGVDIGLKNSIICMRWGTIKPTSRDFTKVTFGDALEAYPANSDQKISCSRISVQLTNDLPRIFASVGSATGYEPTTEYFYVYTTGTGSNIGTIHYFVIGEGDASL